MDMTLRKTLGIPVSRYKTCRFPHTQYTSSLHETRSVNLSFSITELSSCYLTFLGLDSEFALLETALTALYDGYPKLRNHKVKIN